MLRYAPVHDIVCARHIKAKSIRVAPKLRCKNGKSVDCFKAARIFRDKLIVRGLSGEVSAMAQDMQPSTDESSAPVKKRKILSLIRFSLVLILAAAVGATATYFYLSYKQKKNSFDWIQLAPKNDMDLFLSIQAFLKSSIFFPDAKDAYGKAKFLPDEGATKEVQLGYIMTISVESLDLSNVSEKVRKHIADSVGPNAGQLTYEGNFVFTLKDKDGFELAILTSSPVSVTSGKDNIFQGMVENSVPIGIAKRTSQIVFDLELNKCLNCPAP